MEDIPDIPDYAESGDDDESQPGAVHAKDLVRLANEMAQRPRVQQALHEELEACPALRASFHEAAEALAYGNGRHAQGLSRSLLLPRTDAQQERPRRRSLDLSDFAVLSDVELADAKLDLDQEIARGRELQRPPEDDLQQVLRKMGQGLRGVWRAARDSFKNLAESMRLEQAGSETPWRPAQQAGCLRTEGVDTNKVVLAAAVAAATGMLVHSLITGHRARDER